jgi:hypothetical protein
LPCSRSRSSASWGRVPHVLLGIVLLDPVEHAERGRELLGAIGDRCDHRLAHPLRRIVPR